MWDKLDAIDESDSILKEYHMPRCDVCGKSVTLPFYASAHDFVKDYERCFNYCFSCIDEPLDLDAKVHITENPKANVKCVFCDRKLNFEYKRWYYFSREHVEFDACRDCIDGSDIIGSFSRKMKEYNIPRLITDEYRYISRCYDIYCDVSPAEIRKVPRGFGVTEERIGSWSHSIGSIVYVPHDFGTIKKWGQFTDIYDIPEYPASTFLLVDCAGGDRVACGIIDDHGRVAVYNLCTKSEYFAEYEAWKTRPRPEGEELERQRKNIENLIRTEGCDEEFIAGLCEEFSGFVCMMRKFPTYYG